MARSIRHFIYLPDGNLRTVPHAFMERLRRGEARLPRYAGERIKGIDVTVDSDAGRAIAVRDVRPTMMTLDDKGAIASDLRDRLRDSLSGARARRADAWTPTREQIAEVKAQVLKPAGAIALRATAPRRSGRRSAA
jgi:hypothetical protein